MNVIYPAIRSAVYPAVRGVLDISEKKQTSEQIIQSLFTQGQQGFWLPFTDFASLSQDSAGTLPYTALQQPVGLILDKSKGGGRGPEMVADPEMTTLVGLSNNGNLSSPFEIVPWQGASTALHVVGARFSGTIIPGTSANTLYYVEARIWVVTGSVYFGSPTVTVGGAVVTASSGWQEVKGYISNSSAGLPILSNVADSEWYLDRISIRQVLGNHASQVTSTARGVVSARVNMLASTQSFGGGSGWASGTGIVVTSADIPSPLGGMADKIEMTAAGSDWRQLLQSVPTTVGSTYAGRVLIKAASPADVGKVIAFRHAGASAYLLITLTADWAWVGRDEVSLNSSTNFAITHRPAQGTTSGVISFHLAAAELKLSNQASLPYQRVNTATDYDAVGFPKYLRLDGTDDSYTCGGGGSTTGFFYSDVVRPTTSTFSALLADNTASGGYLVQRTNTGIYFSANAGAAITSVSLPLAANVQAFVSAMDDGVNLTLQVNGAEASIARPVVTAGASTMYLGRYTTTAQYFNGTMTEPIYRAGPPPNAYERDVIRNYQKQKAGML